VPTNQGDALLRLLVVEDHALVREGLLQTLHKLSPRLKLFEAEDAEGALHVVEKEKEFDLVLLDLMLPGMNGMAMLTVMRKRFPAVPVLVISALGDAETVRRAMRQGASGFVPKSSSGEVLLDAVRRVLDGELYLPAYLRDSANAEQMDDSKRDPTGTYGLTAAQLRVLDLLKQGKSNREIGELLGLTEGTVKLHVSKIFKALKVSSRAQALVILGRKRSKL